MGRWRTGRILSMGIFEIKPEIHGGFMAWCIGGFFGLIGIISTTAVKVLTRGHITRKEAFKTFSTKEVSDINDKHLEEKVEDLKETVNQRFDDLGNRFEDLRSVILKNGRH